METTKITIQARISANRQKVWDYYTQASHITKWNFADPSWHCPNATNDMKVGGIYNARMEVKHYSHFGFTIFFKKHFRYILCKKWDYFCFLFVVI
jgi:uncharacterized protein YndB with AHSA1/START domain